MKELFLVLINAKHTKFPITYMGHNPILSYPCPVSAPQILKKQSDREILPHNAKHSLFGIDIVQHLGSLFEVKIQRHVKT